MNRAYCCEHSCDRFKSCREHNSDRRLVAQNSSDDSYLAARREPASSSVAHEVRRKRKQVLNYTEIVHMLSYAPDAFICFHTLPTRVGPDGNPQR